MRRPEPGEPSQPAAPRLRPAQKPPVRSPWWGGLLRFALGFIAVVFLIDAVFGQRGFIETMRARREHEEVAAAITALRRENARLREVARRLREDPEAVEELARRELGLIKPGELLFIVKDVDRPGDRLR